MRRGRAERRRRARVIQRRREALLAAHGWDDLDPRDRGALTRHLPLRWWTSGELGGCRLVRGWPPPGRGTKRRTHRLERRRAAREVRQALREEV